LDTCTVLTEVVRTATFVELYDIESIDSLPVTVDMNDIKDDFLSKSPKQE
jgi:hypothetical protein